ncbi:hypothetical protein MSj_04213 [Microcystis aeruginosa Sj]|uniref:Uncharacterized protein n=1 Tax=Microcystis aeruginosa Sj TaxID=1979544 RepID=A0A2Z6UZM3_MICAE|nr:hypothetical protein MSj_04213 [Microcystis aeruginosa Sj]
MDSLRWTDISGPVAVLSDSPQVGIGVAIPIPITEPGCVGRTFFQHTAQTFASAPTCQISYLILIEMTTILFTAGFGTG